MNEPKNTISEAQKVAQKKYDQKTKMVSIKYTPADMTDYKKLKDYLDNTGQPINSFIKGLINEFFESEQNQKKRNKESNVIKNPVEEKRFEEITYSPFSYIDEENIQFLSDKFGEQMMKKILDGYYEAIEYDVNEIFEDNGYKFDEWVQVLEERMEEGEFQTGTQEKICEELLKDIYENF